MTNTEKQLSEALKEIITIMNGMPQRDNTKAAIELIKQARKLIKE